MYIYIYSFKSNMHIAQNDICIIYITSKNDLLLNIWVDYLTKMW